MATLSPLPDILQTAGSGKAEDLRDQLRLRCLRSTYYLAKVVLGYDKLVDYYHLPLCNRIQDSTHPKRGFLHARAHFKSTCGAKAYPLWRLLPVAPELEEFLTPDLIRLHNPNLRIGIVGEADDVAAKDLIDIKWHIENNQLFRWLFPEIIPPSFNDTVWAKQSILLPRSKSFDEPSIVTMGVGTKRTGFHYDLLIYDDPIGDKAAASASVMQGAIDWFQYATGLLDDPESSEEVMFGTRWKYGTADLYGWIMESLPPDGKRGFVFETRAAIENGQPIFPDRFTLKGLEDIRRRQGTYKFSCQYLNSPTPPEGGDFPEQLIKSFSIADDGQTIVPSDGTPPIKLGQLLRFTAYDPSSGGVNATAENAQVGGGMSPDGRFFGFTEWSKNCSFHAAVENWHVMNDRFKFYKGHYEAVGAQKEIGEIINQRRRQSKCVICEKIHKHLNAEGVQPPGGETTKEERNRAFLQPIMEQGKFYLWEGCTKSRLQLVSFPNGPLKDLVDAWAYCVHMARPPLDEDTVRDLKREEEERLAHPPEPRTWTSTSYGGYI